VADKKTVQQDVAWYKEKRHKYEELSNEVKKIIRETLDERNIVFHSIESRAKSVESFKRKSRRNKYKTPREEITDLTGIRVITLFEKDVYEISNIIKELFKIDYSKSEDKSDLLDADKMGYKSVHYIAQLIGNKISDSELIKYEDLNFEIQIRSILQHAWAEIEHDRNYKFRGELPKHLQRRFYSLSGMLEMADREFNDLDNEVEEYKKKVQRVTKKGQLSLQVNSNSLKEFLKMEFLPEVEAGYLESNFANESELIVNELKEYGIHTLIDLDGIIPDKFYKVLRNRCTSEKTINFSHFLRILMMINDHRKYFERFWPQKGREIKEVCKEIVKDYGININNLIEEYKNR